MMTLSSQCPDMGENNMNFAEDYQTFSSIKMDKKGVKHEMQHQERKRGLREKMAMSY